MLTNSYFNDAAAHKLGGLSSVDDIGTVEHSARPELGGRSAVGPSLHGARVVDQGGYRARAPRREERGGVVGPSAPHVAGRRSADPTAGGGSVPGLRR